MVKVGDTFMNIHDNSIITIENHLDRDKNNKKITTLIARFLVAETKDETHTFTITDKFNKFNTWMKI